jgi:hypothetical protein
MNGRKFKNTKLGQFLVLVLGIGFAPGIAYAENECSDQLIKQEVYHHYSEYEPSVDMVKSLYPEGSTIVVHTKEREPPFIIVKGRFVMTTDRTTSRLQETYLNKEIDELTTDSVVLDIGCGYEGNFVNELRSKNIKAFGVDPGILPATTQKFPHLTSATADKLTQFKDKEFTHIFSNFSVFYYFTHKPDYLNEVLNELARVLTSHGKLNIAVSPNSDLVSIHHIIKQNGKFEIIEVYTIHGTVFNLKKLE